MPFYEKSYPAEFSRKIELPINLKKMIELAEKLSSNHTFLRVDFYLKRGQVLFGEMTFFPGAGFSKFYPEKYDDKLGEELKI